MVVCNGAVQCENTVFDDIKGLISILQHFAEMYSGISSELDSYVIQQNVAACIPFLSQRSGSPGRPRIIISEDQLSGLIEIGFAYTKISIMFGVSARILLRRRIEFSMPVDQSYSSISDDDLDGIIQTLMQVNYQLEIFTVHNFQHN